MMWRHAYIWLAVTAALPAVEAQSSGKGFLFREPTFEITIFSGFARAGAGSDLFEFTTGELTLERSDFSGLDFGADFAFRLSPRTGLVFGVARSGSSKRSEFRDWVDANDQPIEQTTRFARAPLSVSLRYHLVPRGRTVGSLAWIPASFVPWVGLGAGMMQYRFEQAGDFINYETLEVFSDRFTSQGWAPMLQGSVGGGWTLSPKWQLNGELRYVNASGELGADFVGFDRLDLSGFSTSVGLTLRF